MSEEENKETENKSLDNKKMEKVENTTPEKPNLTEESSVDESTKEETPLEIEFEESPLYLKVEEIKDEIGKKLVGQHVLVELIIVGLLSDGHILIEGVPGVAKTYTARLLSAILNASFSRIQFTPDLMPSDVTGTYIYNSSKNDFELKKGPIFNHIILIDEINRAPAKTQAALFECMEESQVSLDGNTHDLPAPFIVLATQNPIEHEGTYRLPEAQLDRFLFKLEVDYPDLEEEIMILERTSNNEIKKDLGDVKRILSIDELATFKKAVNEIHVEKKILKYIAELVQQTRQDAQLFLGASPRASIGILKSSKALAAIKGRKFVTPDDVRLVTYPILSHRIILTPEKEIEGLKASDIVKQIIEKVSIPR